MTVQESAPVPRVDAARAFKDAAIAGLLAFGIFLPLIGFRTYQTMSNELALEGRPGLLAIFVALTVGGSLLMSLVLRPWAARRAATRVPGASVRQAHARAALAKWFVPFALGFLVLYPPMVFGLVGTQGSVKWIDNFGIQILIYIMLGWGLNIVVGLAGPLCKHSGRLN